jgi:hypothetical protein
MEDVCGRCGGDLRQVAILSNYKSFAVVLMQCRACGAKVERKENAHRPAERAPRGADPQRDQSARPQKDARRTPPKPWLRPSGSHQAAQPSRRVRGAQAAARPKRSPAKRLERPFNIRVTRGKGSTGA